MRLLRRRRRKVRSPGGKSKSSSGFWDAVADFIEELLT